MRFVFIATASLLAASCAGMSKGECVYADWHAIGYEDGAAGAPATAISSRRQACARAGVTPDMEAYLAGRDRGLGEYCTPANGFSTGEDGYSYNGVCGRHDEQTFLAEYRAGARLYQLRDRVNGANFALREASADLSSAKLAITQTAAALVRPDVSISARAGYVVELTRLNEESERIERSLPGLHMNVDAAEADLFAYESQLASRPSRAQIAVR